MRRLILAVFGAVVLVPNVALQAQRPVSISLAGGISLPQGSLGDGSDMGWHGLAALNFSSLMLPMGLRVDAAFNRFGSTETGVSLGSDGHYDVGSLTGNLTYRLPMTNSPLSPYLIAGMGAYRTSCNFGTSASCDASTAFGWNAGLGVRMYFLRFRSFLEARYHSTERDASSINYFPLTFGVTF